MLLLLACLLALQQHFCQAQCNHTVGVYSIGNASIFAPALSIIPGMCVKTYRSSALFLQALSAGQVDFSLCTPTLNACIMAQYNYQPVAGLIGSDGSTTISGDILVSSSSQYTTIASLRASRLICGPFYVTAVFQLQADFLNLTDFFSYFSVIAIESNATVLLQALAAGDFDAGFFRSDQQASYKGNFAQDFTVLGSRSVLNSRYRSTTNAFPQWQLTAGPSVSVGDARLAFNALSSLTATDPRSITANISGFGLPYDYDAYHNLLRNLNLVNAQGFCTVTTDDSIFAYVSCPAGATKLSAADVAKRCDAFPQCVARQCICSPCFHPITDVTLGLHAGLFWPLLAVVVGSFWVTSWLVQLNQTGAGMVPSVPQDDIQVLPSRETEELYDNRNGGPKRALHNGQQVSLMPLIGPDPNPGWSKRRTWQRAADACRIDHPNILQAKGVIRQDGIVFLVQANVTTTLRQYVKSTQRDVKDVVRLAKEVACGMQRLHGDDTPILHRPTSRNVLVDCEGHVKLQLCEFTHPPSRSCADDIGHLGWLLQKLWRDSGFSNNITDQCIQSIPRNRPTISHTLTVLTAIEQQLRSSQERLLNSIIPSFASEAMSLGLDVDTKTHESVAILFCDIVGFTTICGKLSAAAVINMLSRLYEAFDNLAIKYEIHKQEIVGDCWVGTTNVLNVQTNDYAARMAMFGLDMIAAAQKTVVCPRTNASTLNVRVGIHVGPVVAGVVGLTLNPKYCVVGNSMNVASRMETTSSANRVHLSEPAANKIADQDETLAARIVPRDQPSHIKGVGMMQTYWLN